MASIHIIKTEDSRFSFNDGLCPGGRTPKLWLVHEGSIHCFQGKSIDRVCVVEHTAYQKNGKWSNTTYQIKVGSAVPVYLLAPLHGKVWPEESWDLGWEAFVKLGLTVSREVWTDVIRRDYPKVAERWNTASAAPELT